MHYEKGSHFIECGSQRDVSTMDKFNVSAVLSKPRDREQISEIAKSLIIICIALAIGFFIGSGWCVLP